MRRNLLLDLSGDLKLVAIRMNKPQTILCTHRGDVREAFFLSTKEPVKLMQLVKIARSFLQSVSNLFHFIILSLPM